VCWRQRPTYYPVPKAVESPRNDEPALVKPIEVLE
jgi:hypothetical protein